MFFLPCSKESADVRRSALNLIINCVCAPVSRPGCASRASTSSSPVVLSTTPTPGAGASANVGGSARKKATAKGSEDLINKLWDCVRSNNGIMALLELLHIKTPITDADSIRMLACRALVGLARSEAAKQVLKQLKYAVDIQ